MAKLSCKEGENKKYKSSVNIPEKYSSVVLLVVRGIFLQKAKVPTLCSILESVQELKVAEVQHLNLFHEDEKPKNDEPIWIWGLTPLYKFMKSVDLINDEKITHY